MRTEATGYGAGNVAIYAIEKAQQLGAHVVACSDSSGYVLDERGIDLDLLRQVREVERERVSVYAQRRGATFVPGRRVWEVGAQVALPCATQNALYADDEYGVPGSYVAGANIAGFVRVADAMLALGVV